MNNLSSRLSLARLSTAFALAFALFCLVMPPLANAQDRQDYALAAGDSIRIQVFQNVDLSIETRVSENGSITYPLVGAVEVGGLSIANAEKKIAAALQRGGFLQNPQVNITVVQMRGNQVSVLGQVGRPGRFALETANTRLSDMLANAGGLAPGGDDVAIVTGVRNGKPLRRSVDIPAIFLDDKSSNDIVLQGGDVVYVHRAPMVYVYGEVQRPGSFRLERDMTVMQALAQGGGPTARGNDSRLRLHRKNAKGQVEELKPQLTDLVQGNDVIFVKENIF
jgi:polysaccharide export outer membrane protein